MTSHARPLPSAGRSAELRDDGSPSAPSLAAPLASDERPVEFRPRWQCTIRDETARATTGALEIPSASIFTDTVVGASLLVRERASHPDPSVARFSAEVHLRSDGPPCDLVQEVHGPPMIGAPWRIEDVRSSVVRRCNLRGECELFALQDTLRFPFRVREESAVFALRVEGPTRLLAIAAPHQGVFVGVARGAESVRDAAFRVPVPRAHRAAGILVEDGALRAVFLRERDGAWIDEDGAPLTLDERACDERAGPSIGVVVLPVALGTFGPFVELRAELARDGREGTCVRRLYGRGAMRFVESSVDVTIRGPSASDGLLRTPRAIHGLRCLAAS
jgi:hypothetical protein